MGIYYEAIRRRGEETEIMTEAKWGDLSETKRGLYSATAVVLSIDSGQVLEATNELNGGLKVIIGFSAPRIAVEGRLFKRHRNRISLDTRLVNETFNTKIPLYAEIADNAVILNGDGFEWPW